MIDVYCDEAFPEAATSKPELRHSNYQFIGSLWTPQSLREQLKLEIKDLRNRHGVHGELKWRKISPSSAELYIDLIKLFLRHPEEELRFRLVYVDTRRVEFDKYHNNDYELYFYKLYYQLLTNWILPGESYRVFCDEKSARIQTRIPELQQVLSNASRGNSTIAVHQIKSSNNLLVQLSDVLLGATTARILERETERPIISDAKRAVVQELERGIGHEIRPTWMSEQKLNVFAHVPGLTR